MEQTVILFQRKQTRHLQNTYIYTYIYDTNTTYSDQPSNMQLSFSSYSS